MMKLLGFLLILLISPYGSFTQDVNFDWAKQAGSTGFNIPWSVVADSSGNVYSTGSFQGTVDFDPGPGVLNYTASGTDDLFIQKLDANGDLVWAHKLGGVGQEVGYSICLDKDENVYSTGLFNGLVDFDPSATTVNFTSFGGSDIYILKLDSDGNYIANYQFGGTSSERGNAITTDTAGNVLATGYYAGTADFDPSGAVDNLVSTGPLSAFVVKLDDAGAYVWAKNLTGSSLVQGNGITTDEAGNVYTSGTFLSDADFDPGLGTTTLVSAGGNDIFLSKLDINGDYVYSGRFGGPGADECYSVAVTTSEEPILSGTFISTADFDPGISTFNLSSMGSTDVFVVKLDDAGVFDWVKQIGGTGTDYSYDTRLDKFDHIYYAGYFQTTSDFDPNAGTENIIASGTDAFVASLNSDGTYRWAKSFSGTGSNITYGLNLDDEGNIYSSGRFISTADFDPGVAVFNLTSAAGSDIFIHKMLNCASDSSFSVNECASYMVPSGDETYTVSGIYNDTLPNAIGCDSLLTIDVTITIADIGVTTNAAGDTLTSDATAPSTYQWIDCDDGNSLIAGETSQEFGATANGNYAVIVDNMGCIDTSACVNVNGIGIGEESFDGAFRVYPNPSRHAFTIDLGSEQENVKLTLRNEVGELIAIYTPKPGSTFEFEISQATGVYFLQIETEVNQSKFLRLIKQ